MSRSELRPKKTDEWMPRRLPKQSEAYLRNIDRLTRTVIKSLHNDAGFAVVAYLMDVRKASFTEIRKALGLNKNALAYSLRKLATTGTIVNYYEKKGDPPKEYSSYGLAEFPKHLLGVANNLLKSVPTERIFVQEQIENLCVIFRGMSRRMEFSALYDEIVNETVAYLRKDTLFAQQANSPIYASTNMLQAIANDNVTWDHFVTALNMAIESFSDEIRLEATMSNISAEVLKAVIFVQIAAYVTLYGTFEELRNCLTKMNSTRVGSQEESFDFLRNLKALGEGSQHD